MRSWRLRGVFRERQITAHTYCPHLGRSERTVIKPDQNVNSCPLL